ncbi:hypothetical protein BGZ83_000917 [Gryganskiella cystojenkinii]|nr:hypothetical protein BGZ83_000917 [Gryganskiella cystojenkinii]
MTSLFVVQCEADGCREMIAIEDMAEHMDRHLAEQLQGQADASLHTQFETKRSWDDEAYDVSTNKKLKNLSAEPFHAKESPLPQQPQQPQKRTGQTTMDGFMSKLLGKRVSPPSPATNSSRPPPPSSSSAGPSSSQAGSSNSPQLTFLEDPLTKRKNIGISGMIEKVRILLDWSKRQGFTDRAYLADTSVLFCQSDKSDRGWGCGYRNIQMMLSYVAAQQHQHPSPSSNHNDHLELPSIIDLQQQIEYAWSHGFDPAGARQLANKVLETNKWIGTTEAWSVLSSMGIRCQMVDFHRPTGPNGTHPELLRVVYEYFCSPDWTPLDESIARSSANTGRSLSSIVEQHGEEFNAHGGDGGGGPRRERIVQTRKPPLYMQHQGHSRTIVGVEILSSGELNLLVFDPGRWIHKSIHTLEPPPSRPWAAPSLTSGPFTKNQTLLPKQQQQQPQRNRQQSSDTTNVDSQYLMKAFRLQLGPGAFTKSQYQLLGVSGLYHDKAQAISSAANEYGLDAALYGDFYDEEQASSKLPLMSGAAALSIGWNDEEREQSKMVSSIRVPTD